MLAFGCSCGRTLRAREDLAGKKTKCPGCGAVLTIPAIGASTPPPASPAGGADDAIAVDLAWPTADMPQFAPAPAAEPPSSQTIRVDSLPAGPEQPLDSIRSGDRARPSDGTLQYKVLSGKDQAASGKFNPLRLEEVLNEHARQGWAVKTAATVTVVGHGGSHDELIVILER